MNAANATTILFDVVATVAVVVTPTPWRTLTRWQQIVSYLQALYR